MTVSGLVTLTAGTLSGSSALNANGGMLINPTGGNSIWTAARSTTRPARPQHGPAAVDDFIEASDGSVFNNLGTFVADGLGFTNESGTGATSVV